ncbi:YhfX family PLP-dependent enzyme [Lactobacillus mulieris]|jgi:predicted amino acid racemase|uniref:alanine racemase n=1 Tax=Lactobacillus TaxID=1578 RepID=UPI0011799B93|nr:MULTISPECIES: alanine racemase [Lactobacillus]KAA9243631.1 YhfX family PLP-dependent enzyme [Lactobacillus jensenii]MCW8124279.1 alanine racemase [Lactobacillus mulieris]MDK7327494.1 alanine racemase [Lactobacillus mulieris]TRT38365.1 YhfX family PLP-dependent enzyme [Lactobacillus sp. c10Ua232AE]TRT41111.1 YhfX family PLP-dependent enzyme [Lactobacillus mulieris]
MFLSSLEQYNPSLISVAVNLHKTGQILPDTYVIDLEALKNNTKKIVNVAKKNNIELLYMTKQLGRNPVIAKTIEEAGIPYSVAVDFREAEMYMENHLHIGNVGNLVQCPRLLVEKILNYGTKYVTVYSISNLKYINDVARKLGIIQKVLLKVIGENDELYPGQVGGLTLKELDNNFDEIVSLKYIQLSGITVFPALLYNHKVNKIEPTSSLKTVNDVKLIFKKHNYPMNVLSLPSATCCDSIPLIKKLGGTEGEPGHGLTGTTPMHAFNKEPEIPAYCYVSEISHNFKKHSYFYAGGFYRRGHLKNALVFENDKEKTASVLPFDDESIDYYLELNQPFKEGSTVITAFRTQIFVTRSSVALVDGITSGKPNLIGIFDSQGRPLPEGMK